MIEEELSEKDDKTDDDHAEQEKQEEIGTQMEEIQEMTAPAPHPTPTNNQVVELPHLPALIVRDLLYTDQTEAEWRRRLSTPMGSPRYRTCSAVLSDSCPGFNYRLTMWDSGWLCNDCDQNANLTPTSSLISESTLPIAAQYVAAAAATGSLSPRPVPFAGATATRSAPTAKQTPLPPLRPGSSSRHSLQPTGPQKLCLPKNFSCKYGILESAKATKRESDSEEPETRKSSYLSPPDTKPQPCVTLQACRHARRKVRCDRRKARKALAKDTETSAIPASRTVVLRRRMETRRFHDNIAAYMASVVSAIENQFRSFMYVDQVDHNGGTTGQLGAAPGAPIAHPESSTFFSAQAAPQTILSSVYTETAPSQPAQVDRDEDDRGTAGHPSAARAGPPEVSPLPAQAPAESSTSFSRPSQVDPLTKDERVTEKARTASEVSREESKSESLDPPHPAFSSSPATPSALYSGGSVQLEADGHDLDKNGLCIAGSESPLRDTRSARSGEGSQSSCSIQTRNTESMDTDAPPSNISLLGSTSVAQDAGSSGQASSQDTLAAALSTSDTVSGGQVNTPQGTASFGQGYSENAPYSTTTATEASTPAPTATAVTEKGSDDDEDYADEITKELLLLMGEEYNAADWAPEAAPSTTNGQSTQGASVFPNRRILQPNIKRPKASTGTLP